MSVTNAKGLPDTGGPNYIINGAFDIWQRGTSFTPSFAGAFQADHWAFGMNGASGITITRENLTPSDIPQFDGQYFYRLVTTGADSAPRPFHRIEDVRTLAGRTVTLSFWAKASVASLLQSNSFLLQNFGSGGSSQVATSFTLPALTTSWQRVSVSVTLPSVAGKTIGAGSNLEINLRPTGSTAFTLDITGVQLEAGSVATPFRRNANSLQGELAACQRYYRRLDSSASSFATFGVGQCGTTNQASFYIPHATMRAKPSVTTLDATKLAATSSNFGNAVGSSFAVNGARQTIDATLATLTTASALLVAGNASVLIANNNTDAVIELSAEL